MSKYKPFAWLGLAFFYITTAQAQAAANAPVLPDQGVCTHDELGDRISQTDANGHTTGFEYDALGRETRSGPSTFRRARACR